MNLAIWYHIRLFGGNPYIDPDHSIPLMMDQMNSLEQTGLLASAEKVFICVNGGTLDQAAARSLAPAKAVVLDNGPQAESLLPTVERLWQWANLNPDWYVLFFHAKGVTHPQDPLTVAWRHCMEYAVLTHWRRCVADLDAGYDTVGAHWLTRERYGPQVTFPFWGGMFYWVRAAFLAELPRLPLAPATRADWFLPENWIGMCRAPRVKDYAPHWPNLQACSYVSSP